MNIRLDASDDTVVSYLENLWRGTVAEQPIDVMVAEQPIDVMVAEQPIDVMVAEQPIDIVDNNVKVELIVMANEEVQVKLTVESKELPKEVPKEVPKELQREQFTKQVKENLKALRDIGFRVYHNVSLEKEVNLNPGDVNNNDLNAVYNFKVASQLTRNMLMKDISRCNVFPKHKSGDVTKPENFRYLVNHHNAIKILDRLWCIDVMTKCGNNLPDTNIYKAALLRNFSPSVILTAITNTMTTDNTVLLDIIRAFDSLEWNILEELILANLTRKINATIAKELVSQYMTVLKNRELYYNNKRVIVSKGISTGLPSSNLVFTLAFEEIIHRWFASTNYKNGVDFKLNVYVDDIYMKMLQLNKTKEIILSLSTFISTYGLYINPNKSKADKKLGLEMKELNNTDYYLGIPFTRDIDLYGELILKEFQTNKLKLSWTDMYHILTSYNHTEDQSIVLGFLNYKLRPLIHTEHVDREIIAEFIKTHYVKNYNICNIIGNMFSSVLSFLSNIVNSGPYKELFDI